MLRAPAAPKPASSGVLNSLGTDRAPIATDDASAGFAFGSVWYAATLKMVFVCWSATTGAAVWEPLAHGAEIDFYSSYATGQTWKKAPWARRIEFFGIGGGGAGGSGSVGACGSAASTGNGGAGGGSGQADMFFDSADDWPSTYNWAFPGGPAAGGAAVTTNDTAGVMGSNGATINLPNGRRLFGGDGGNAPTTTGTSAASGRGGKPGRMAPYGQLSSGNGGSSGGVGANVASQPLGPVPGSGGGGVTAAQAFTTGGSVYPPAEVSSNGAYGASAGAGTAGIDGTSYGTSANKSVKPGGGGTGGNGQNVAGSAAGNGGKGGDYGGGGGGGGGAINGSTSGKGGDGGGFAILIIQRS